MRGSLLPVRKMRCLERFPREAVDPPVIRGLSDLHLWFPEVTGPRASASFHPPVQFGLRHHNQFWNNFLILDAKLFVIQNTLLFLIVRSRNNVFLILLAKQNFAHESSTNFLQKEHFSFSPYYWQVLKE